MVSFYVENPAAKIQEVYPFPFWQTLSKLPTEVNPVSATGHELILLSAVLYNELYTPVYSCSINNIHLVLPHYDDHEYGVLQNTEETKLLNQKLGDAMLVYNPCRGVY